MSVCVYVDELVNDDQNSSKLMKSCLLMFSDHSNVCFRTYSVSECFQKDLKPPQRPTDNGTHATVKTFSTRCMSMTSRST